MTQTFARIDAGVVAELFLFPDGTDIIDCFHPSLIADIKVCTGSVAPGWIYDGKTFTAPAISLPTVEELTAYAANKRFQIETGGVIVNGLMIATDRESQSLITGAYNYVQANPNALVKFKAATGFIELTATEMAAIADAVGAHVQACFAVEESVDSAISAGNVKTFSDIDAFSWPAKG